MQESESQETASDHESQRDDAPTAMDTAGLASAWSSSSDFLMASAGTAPITKKNDLRLFFSPNAAGKQAPQSSPALSQAAPTHTAWVCGACTFRNVGRAATRCQMCRSVRPPLPPEAPVLKQQRGSDADGAAQSGNCARTTTTTTTTTSPTCADSSSADSSSGSGRRRGTQSAQRPTGHNDSIVLDDDDDIDSDSSGDECHSTGVIAIDTPESDRDATAQRFSPLSPAAFVHLRRAASDGTSTTQARAASDKAAPKKAKRSTSTSTSTSSTSTSTNGRRRRGSSSQIGVGAAPSGAVSEPGVGLSRFQFCVSEHTGRIWLYTRAGRPLHVNFHPQDFVHGNFDALPAMVTTETARPEISHFLRQFRALRPVQQKAVANIVMPDVQSGLEQQRQSATAALCKSASASPAVPVAKRLSRAKAQQTCLSASSSSSSSSAVTAGASVSPLVDRMSTTRFTSPAAFSSGSSDNNDSSSSSSSSSAPSNKRSGRGSGSPAQRGRSRIAGATLHRFCASMQRTGPSRPATATAAGRGNGDSCDGGDGGGGGASAVVVDLDSDGSGVVDHSPTRCPAGDSASDGIDLAAFEHTTSRRGVRGAVIDSRGARALCQGDGSAHARVNGADDNGGSSLGLDGGCVTVQQQQQQRNPSWINSDVDTSSSSGDSSGSENEDDCRVEANAGNVTLDRRHSRPSAPCEQTPRLERKGSGESTARRQLLKQQQQHQQDEKGRGKGKQPPLSAREEIACRCVRMCVCV